MLKKFTAGFLIFSLVWCVIGCNRKDNLTVVESELPFSESEGTEEILLIESWRNTYAEFLNDSASYIEDEYFAETFALVDLDNSGIPELIIVYYNGLEGGAIFANIYSYEENISIIGRRIDMYYKQAWLSVNPLFAGLFVEGGRTSTFSCNYWTVIDNEFIDEPVWSLTPYIDEDTLELELEYKDLSDNEQLIAEAKKYPSSLPDSGTFDLNDTVEFFEIDEANITEVIYGGV